MRDEPFNVHGQFPGDAQDKAQLLPVIEIGNHQDDFIAVLLNSLPDSGQVRVNDLGMV